MQRREKHNKHANKQLKQTRRRIYNAIKVNKHAILAIQTIKRISHFAGHTTISQRPHTNTHTHTHTHTHHTHTHTEHRHTSRQELSQSDKLTGRMTLGQIYRPTDKTSTQSYRQEGSHAYTQTDRKDDIQANIMQTRPAHSDTDKQAGRQTNKLVERPGHLDTRTEVETTDGKGERETSIH